MARKGGNPEFRRIRNSNTEAANRRRRELADEHIRTVLPVLADLAENGIESMQERANVLNERGLLTRAGKPWTDKAVRRMYARLKQGTVLRRPTRRDGR